MHSMMGMWLVPSLGDYLGLPSVVSRNKDRDFKSIKDRVWGVMQSWKKPFFLVWW